MNALHATATAPPRTVQAVAARAVAPAPAPRRRGRGRAGAVAPRTRGPVAPVAVARMAIANADHRPVDPATYREAWRTALRLAANDPRRITRQGDALVVHNTITQKGK